MKDYAVDLHIHSCLSPCGDELMTPNNIGKMSLLKGLDLIAVTDHNTAGNLPAVQKVCREIGLNLLPGLEVTTREEVHLLAYFKTVGEALAFSDYIYPHLPPIKNRPEFFGPQQVMNDADEVTGEEEKLLLSALDLSIDLLASRILEMGGLPVPAHINRGGNGLLNALGFLPPGANYAALEIVRGLPCPPLPGTFRRLHSSDAHQLDAILEREVFLTMAEPTAKGFFDFLNTFRS